MDPYKVLGVDRNTNENDLKKAYKTKAMKHHPDRGGDEAKFKELNEAYDVLKDPQKKAAYDRYGTTDMHRQGGDNHTYNFNGDINDIFNNFFGGGGPFQRASTFRSNPRNVDINIEATLELEDVHNGKSLIASYRLPNGRQESVNIDIPPGVEHNNMIRFAGLGADTISNAPRGDLIVRIKILRHKTWERDGINLHSKIKVNVFDLILGTKKEIRTLSGKNFSVSIPKGTQTGTVFNITGEGLPHVHNARQRGNLYITVMSDTPRVEDAALLQKIKNLRDELD
jgi:curved DNA-binding protein